MLIGPVFTRELAIAPRRLKLYVVRAAYVLALLVLMGTAWLVLTGTQLVEDIGDLARFGASLFQILATLQLALATFFAATLTATEVAHEKDRRTLILLLLTRLSNSELVLGKLLASLLGVLVMLLAALPVFLLIALLGGVSYGQIARATAVTLATVLVCGSLGSLLALWREKTFQALAMTVLILVLWLAVGEIVAAGALGETIAGLPCRALAAGLSPWQAILEATRPWVQSQGALGPLGTPVHLFLLVAAAMTLLLNGVAVGMVRVWNPSREAMAVVREEDEAGEGSGVRGQRSEVGGQGSEVRGQGSETKGSWAAELSSQRAENPLIPNPQPLTPNPQPLIPNRHSTRRVWDNPIIWREIRTWAYGRKILVVRLAYLTLFALAAAGASSQLWGGPTAGHVPIAWVLAPLALLSLVLVNAQAVTSLTSERDVKALDLLLVTDLTPKEIVYGKLGGVFYNTKEMVLLPMLLSAGFWAMDLLSLENLLYVLGGLAALYLFVAMLGLHVGMIYANSGVAVATSLGTVFFSVPRRGGVHENHDGLQRLVQRAVSAVFRLHGVWRGGPLRGAGRPQPLERHRHRVVPLPDRHVLRHHQLFDGAALAAGNVPGHLGRLRLHHPVHAGAGPLRVRRGHGKNDAGGMTNV